MAKEAEAKNCPVPDVVARVVTMAVTPDDAKKHTRSLDNPQEKDSKHRYHQQPGSKVRFTLDEKGNQVRLDAYTYKLKVKAIHVIEAQAKKTKVPEKRAFLEKWAQEFRDKTPREIFKIMAEELEKKDSPLKKHSFVSIGTLFPKAAATGTELALGKLIDEAIKYFDSEHVMQHPVATGRRSNK